MSVDTAGTIVRPVKNRGVLQRIRDYPLRISVADLPANVFGGDEWSLSLVNTKGSLSHILSLPGNSSPLLCLFVQRAVQSSNKAALPFKDLLIDANSVRQIPLRAFKVTEKEAAEDIWPSARLQSFCVGRKVITLNAHSSACEAHQITSVHLY